MQHISLNQTDALHSNGDKKNKKLGITQRILFSCMFCENGAVACPTKCFLSLATKYLTLEKMIKQSFAPSLVTMLLTKLPNDGFRERFFMLSAHMCL